MKKILVLVLVILSILTIYLTTMDKEVYYLALGDSSKEIINDNGEIENGYSFYVQNYLKEKEKLEKYVYEFSNSNIRISDLINDINDNKKIKNVTLKNALIKADLVTLRINADDIFLKLESESVNYSDIYNYIDDLSLDLEQLFILMREYCKERIIFIGYNNQYESEEMADIIYYMNKKYKEICRKYNISYIDISDLNNVNSKKIGNKVISISNKLLFNA